MKTLATGLLLCLALHGGLALAYVSPDVEVSSASERMDAARAAVKAKDWKRAIVELNAAAREEPGNADIHNLLGYSYRLQAPPNLPKSFEHYNTALKLDPRHKGAHHYLGEAYLLDKKPLEAEKQLAKLEALCSNKTCEEYALLAKSLAAYKASAK